MQDARYSHRVIRTSSLAAASLSLLLLTGCASAVPTAKDTAADAVVDAPSDEDQSNDAPDDAVARIGSCDTVEAVVAPYIQNLVAMESNVVDEWGVSCQWEMAEGETDWANNRSVSVGISPEPLEKPDLALLTDASDAITAVDDAWVAQQDGVAYTMTMETAVATAIVTTVWLPYAEITVTGGKWGDHPALDGPAAVQVAKALLG